MNGQKIVIDVKKEHALVLWVGSITPYVTVMLEKGVNVGDVIDGWYHGHYFGKLQEAVTDLKKRARGN